MGSKENISSILDAIDQINLKKKKRITKPTSTQLSIPKFNQDLTIPPDVDKLISEAEEYKKKTIVSSKILPIENQLFDVKNETAFILTEEVISETINSKIENQIFIQQKDKIKNLDETVKKLRAQIIDLKKNETLLSKENNNSNAFNESENFISNTKENLKSIYSQVEKQKYFFLELKEHSIKIKRDSAVYKENYERLVIENNELKTRLKITKEQITDYETNKKNLLSALDHLNEILLKSNVVGKISPNKSPLKTNDIEKSTKIDSIE